MRPGLKSSVRTETGSFTLTAAIQALAPRPADQQEMLYFFILSVQVKDFMSLLLIKGWQLELNDFSSTAQWLFQSILGEAKPLRYKVFITATFVLLRPGMFQRVLGSLRKNPASGRPLPSCVINIYCYFF